MVIEFEIVWIRWGLCAGWYAAQSSKTTPGVLNGVVSRFKDLYLICPAHYQ